MLSSLNFLWALPAVLAAPSFPDAPTASQAQAVAGSWIIKLKPNSSIPEMRSHFQRANIVPTYEYNIGESFKGFAVDGITAITTLLSSIPDIESIEPNVVFSINKFATQENSTWGLARISHENNGQNNTYVYDESAGNGSTAYVIDTGIYLGHNDFGGRAVWGANFANDSMDTDLNGHGTHVAGTIGGGTYGVAKSASLIAVKVLDASGSGTNAGVLAGLDWAVNHTKANNMTGKAVANLSLGGLRSSVTNDAFKAAIGEGLPLFVAAGNDGFFAYFSSPASEPSVCTVGATDEADALASFSNFGTLVDILAPGVDILSTWIGNPDALNTISGTSMATPHVTGLAAYFLGLPGAEGYVPSEPQALCKFIQEYATEDAVALGTWAGFLGNTVNLLAYNGNDDGLPPQGPSGGGGKAVRM